jgi:hypothetical protein
LQRRSSSSRPLSATIFSQRTRRPHADSGNDARTAFWKPVRALTPVAPDTFDRPSGLPCSMFISVPTEETIILLFDALKFRCADSVTMHRHAGVGLACLHSCPLQNANSGTFQSIHQQRRVYRLNFSQVAAQVDLATYVLVPWNSKASANDVVPSNSFRRLGPAGGAFNAVSKRYKISYHAVLLKKKEHAKDQVCDPPGFPPGVVRKGNGVFIVSVTALS